MLAIAIAHAVYAAIVRPFFRRLDTTLSVVGAVITLCQCGAALAAATSSAASAMEALGVITLLQGWYFVLPLAATVAWQYVLRNRRTRLLLAHNVREDDETAATATPNASAAGALLETLPGAAMTPPTDTVGDGNPLLQLRDPIFR